MSTVVADKTCPKCGESHDEAVAILIDAEVHRIPDGDLASELAYVRRELAGEPEDVWRASLLHRASVLEADEARRRRLAAKGAPLYQARDRIDPELVRDLKARIDLTTIISQTLRPAWTRGGRSYFYCPAHGDGVDRNPSFVVFEGEGRYHCFGCDAGGDVLAWVMANQNIGFREAVEVLRGWVA